MNKLKRNIFSLVAVATSMFAVVSCMEESIDTENEVDHYETMDAWMKKSNYSHLAKVKGEDGFYMNITKNSAEDAKKPSDSSYVYISYTSKYVNSDDEQYIANTDIDLARKMGKYSSNARYVPFMFRLGEYGYYLGITGAHREALLKMSVGDEAEIVVAANGLGYPYDSPTYEGFGGVLSINSYMKSYAHIVMKLEHFAERIRVEVDAENAVDEYVEVNEFKRAKDGVYYKKDVNFINDNQADSVRKDSTLMVKYVGRFMDGFVFDTNIKDTADYHHLTNKKFENFSYNYINDVDSVNDGMIKAWKHVVSKMRLGEKATMIAYPSFCYGKDGVYGNIITDEDTGISISTGALIYSYTPLIFDIEIVKKEEEED